MEITRRDFLRFSVAAGSATAIWSDTPLLGMLFVFPAASILAALMILLAARFGWNILARMALVALFFCCAACTSPEATRTRGGGPGADVGNKTKVVRMHEGSRPFEGTPKIIETKHPPLDPAYQADELSRQ